MRGRNCPDQWEADVLEADWSWGCQAASWGLRRRHGAGSGAQGRAWGRRGSTAKEEALGIVRWGELWQKGLEGLLGPDPGSSMHPKSKRVSVFRFFLILFQRGAKPKAGGSGMV